LTRAALRDHVHRVAIVTGLEDRTVRPERDRFPDPHDALDVVGRETGEQALRVERGRGFAHRLLDLRGRRAV
jgi:hypothetical protein